MKDNKTPTEIDSSANTSALAEADVIVLVEADTAAVEMDTTTPVNLRWRIVGGEIPLRERRIRSLDPLGLPAPLTAWVRSRLEWAVDNLLDKNSEGVLCLAIDPQKDVVVSLEEARIAPELTVDNLIEQDDVVVGVEVKGRQLVGVVFCEQKGALFASTEELISAPATLVKDLAATLGFELTVAPLTPSEIEQADAAFLVSDEFGYVSIELADGKTAAKTAAKTEPDLTAPAQKLKTCLDKVFYPA
ncbi:MAG: hypothetical protein LBB42_03965 [Coriobacteriales bacterium]|nr:hypothetical protein [Coriobacteriales bacterium]